MSRGALYMLGSALAFSLMTVLVKQVGARLPSQEIVLARAIVSLVLSYAMIRRAGIEPLGHHRGLLLVRGLLGFIGLSCVFYSVTHLPLAEATVIQYLHPTFTAVLAALLLREHVRWPVLVAGTVSLLGVVVVARPGALLGLLPSAEAAGVIELPPLALMAAVSGAFFSGAAYVVVRRLARSEHPLVIVIYFPLVTIPATLPTLWGHAVWPSGWEWPWLLGVGILTQAGQVWLTRGLALLPAAHGTALSYAQVVFAICWGVLFFDEWPGGWTLIGAAMVILGTGLVTRVRSGVQSR